MADITQPSSDSNAQIETPPQGLKAPETQEDPAAKATIDALKGQSNDAITETVKNRSSLKETLTEQLNGAAKVETPAWTPEELKGKEVLAITVEDKERFLEDGPMKALEPLVGHLVYNTFQQRGEEGATKYPVHDEASQKELIDEYFRDGDIAITDKIYLILEQGKVASLYFLKHRTLEGGQKICHLLLSVTDKPFRKTPSGYQNLARTVFKNEEVDAFSGLTHTPAAVKTLRRVGNMEDMNVYFAGQRITNTGEPLTEQEQRMLSIVKKGDIDEMVKEYGFEEHQEGLPPEYVSYGPYSIPPRKREEVLLKNDDPLRKIFMELIDTADTKPGHAIYGTVLIPKHPEKF